MKGTIDSAEAMEMFGAALAAVARAGDVIVLTGELGAGKTTFARGFGAGLGLETPVSSPTFIVARTHARSQAGLPALVHIDAYRLGSAAELEELDVDLTQSIVLAEWAAPFASVLADSWLEIELVRPRATSVAHEDEGGEPRGVLISVHGPRVSHYQRFLDAGKDHL
jgi:tRNA threonylcarbamoyladenosine biosynthesis protein TsaE